MGKPYVYDKGGAFPAGKRPRMVRLNAILSNQNVAQSVFLVPEGAWVYGCSAELMADPSRWVRVGIDLISTRAAALNVKAIVNTRKSFLGKVIVTRSYPYTAQFLASYQVLHSVFFGCLEPANRPRFAYELNAQRYEREVLRANHYTSAVIAGVLAENPGPQSPAVVSGTPATVVLIQCAHCRRSYEYTSISCPRCGAPR